MDEPKIHKLTDKIYLAVGGFRTDIQTVYVFKKESFLQQTWKTLSGWTYGSDNSLISLSLMRLKFLHVRSSSGLKNGCRQRSASAVTENLFVSVRYSAVITFFKKEIRIWLQSEPYAAENEPLRVTGE